MASPTTKTISDAVTAAIGYPTFSTIVARVELAATELKLDLSHVSVGKGVTVIAGKGTIVVNVGTQRGEFELVLSMLADGGFLCESIGDIHEAVSDDALEALADVLTISVAMGEG